LFDGEDPDAVDAARARWSEAKQNGFAVTYWQPDEAGRWQRKA
jgi:DNA polymerase-3 subunit chi